MIPQDPTDPAVDQQRLARPWQRVEIAARDGAGKITGWDDGWLVDKYQGSTPDGKLAIVTAFDDDLQWFVSLEDVRRANDQDDSQSPDLKS